MKKLTKSGHVLVHVLITTIIVCVIAAGLAQMVLMRYTANARLAGGLAGRKQDEGSFNAVLNVWNSHNRACYDNGTALSSIGFSCVGCGTVADSASSASDKLSDHCACTVQPVGCTCPAAGTTDSNPALCPGILTASWDSVAGRCKISVASCQ